MNEKRSGCAKFFGVLVAFVGLIAGGIAIYQFVDVQFLTSPPTSTPRATPTPQVRCDQTLLAGEEVRCDLEIEGPGVLSIALTPSTSRTTWEMSVNGLTDIGRGCTFTPIGGEMSPESRPPFSFVASGQLEIRCPVFSGESHPRYRITFQDRTNISNFDLHVEADFGNES